VNERHAGQRGWTLPAPTRRTGGTAMSSVAMALLR
jgi:hypothetical protein